MRMQVSLLDSLECFYAAGDWRASIHSFIHVGFHCKPYSNGLMARQCFCTQGDALPGVPLYFCDHFEGNVSGEQLACRLLLPGVCLFSCAEHLSSCNSHKVNACHSHRALLSMCSDRNKCLQGSSVGEVMAARAICCT